ncbi:TPA: ABC transporter [Salmonella enterica]|uniref:ABC transporter n=2 Tax=Salmonella enterica TaxID=28901 RepID=A0A8E7D045_SALNE|nr:ABC transporter [Salmonella enterica]EFQ1244424.1 ABC transporter [Salmonella enterica subsp. enterica serovar Newport]EBN5685355.1 ABC transporter [Salmonella enterica]EDS3212225.1 ABC transporter [Salmonella enterica]EEO6029985.1 ABC transporter [Salmonella enterica]
MKNVLRLLFFISEIKGKINFLINRIKVVFLFTTRVFISKGYINELMIITKFLCKLKVIKFWKNDLDVVAEENFKCLMGKKPAVSLTWSQVRRILLDEGATWARDKEIEKQITDCAKILDDYVSGLKKKGDTVILAPLHFLSDTIATVIASRISPKVSTVIVSNGAEKYREVCSNIESGKLNFCSIHQGNNDFSMGLIPVINDVMEGKQNIIIFPDIPVDYTKTVSNLSGYKFNCKIFNRAASLHTGVIRLSKILSATVVFFYIYYDDGIKINILKSVKKDELKHDIHRIIEDAIKTNPEQWLLWNNYSLFYTH